MHFLYLSEKDMIEAGVKEMDRCIASMEYTFELLQQNDYRLGGANNSSHGLRLMFPNESEIKNMPLNAPGRWFTAMPAYLGGKYHKYGLKFYGANQENSQKNLPRSILMMALMDIETGIPLAYMSANILSAMRTGAVSGVFAKRFAPANAKKIAVVGPGIMARYSLESILYACSEIEEIRVLGRGERNKKKFYNYCKNLTNSSVSYKDCNTMEEACMGADIIVTANTQAEKFRDYPLIKKKYVKKGACIIVVSAIRIDRSFLNGIGEECALVADFAEMYVEKRGIDAKPETDEEKTTVTVKGAIHETIMKGKEVINLPDIVANSEYKREDNKIYICASGGIPIEDVAWASECYENALKKNIGQNLLLWEESEL